MIDSKFNKLYNNTLLIAAVLVIFTSLLLEKPINFTFIDILFIGILILLLLIIVIYKDKFFPRIILFYDFILISSLFIFNLKTTILVIVLSLLFYSIFISFYGGYQINLQTNSIILEGFIIIISLFLTKGSVMVFTNFIDDVPLLLVQVILLNLFYHLFYYILSSLDFLIQAKKLKQLKILDNLNIIFINFVYTTTLTYLALTLYTLIGYISIIILLILNTVVAFLFIKSYKEEQEKECMSIIQQAVKTSLHTSVNINQKIYAYIEAMNNILPSTILGLYFFFDNHKSILPVSHKYEENINLRDLSLCTDKLSNFMTLIESGSPITLIGSELSSYFSFIKELNMEESLFIIVPLTINAKSLGFTLIHPKYHNYNNGSVKLLVEAQSCLGLLMEQNFKTIYHHPLKLNSYSDLYKCMEEYIENKLTFTLTKIYVKNINSNINFKNKSLQSDIINIIDKTDKILFLNKDTFYLIHTLEDSLNVLNLIQTLKHIIINKLDSTIDDSDILYTNIEYPTDANNIFDITSKLS
ncbi:hypothetical protein ACQPU1_03480 [Clostridium paraputrificum]|uniref:hypothetical protein n=1 Tax=Clostridium TaxID=1485 RepID=UPI003D32F302